jgi:hypothetical protein
MYWEQVLVRHLGEWKQAAARPSCQHDTLHESPLACIVCGPVALESLSGTAYVLLLIPLAFLPCLF